MTPPNELDPSDPTRFDAVIRQQTAGSRDVSVVVYREGRVVHEWMRSPDLGPTARFRIASVSKMVTALTVMRLVDRGLIDLDEPVVGELASAHGWNLGDPAAASITTRQLLSHTSGLPAAAEIFFDSPDTTMDAAMASVLALPLVTPPGSGFQYSNANFVLLGYVIEAVTDRPWSDVSRDEVTIPLGLLDFETVSTDHRAAGDAPHYVREGRNYMELLGPAGAWVASAESVARLLASIDPNEPSGIVSARLRRMMTTPSSSGVADGSWTYGLGVRIFPGGTYGHTGTIESVRAVALHFPDGTIVVVLVNGDRPRVTDDLVEAMLFVDWAANQTLIGRSGETL